VKQGKNKKEKVKKAKLSLALFSFYLFTFDFDFWQLHHPRFHTKPSVIEPRSFPATPSWRPQR